MRTPTSRFSARRRQKTPSCSNFHSVDNGLIDGCLKLIGEATAAVRLLNHSEVEHVFLWIGSPGHARRSIPPIRTHRRPETRPLRLHLQAEPKAGVAEEGVIDEELLEGHAGQMVLCHELHRLA